MIVRSREIQLNTGEEKVVKVYENLKPRVKIQIQEFWLNTFINFLEGEKPSYIPEQGKLAIQVILDDIIQDFDLRGIAAFAQNNVFRLLFVGEFKRDFVIRFIPLSNYTDPVSFYAVLKEVPDEDN